MDTIGPKRTKHSKGKKIVIESNDKGCLVCTSHTPNPDGYIRLFVSNDVKPRMQFLHRIEWEKANGAIPEGYELDHICRNRNCCNIEHLQLLTRTDHKTKTNLERYSERTLLIKKLIEEGFKVSYIADVTGVTPHTVNRIKRKGNK